ncbi:MAG: cystathionine gamma-synthase family protein [Chitinophagales bacterium]|jgi:methionine-gamma-lyase|nr:cystathionine gamma-synthase family protein [Chitinophagales bacterium]
MSKEFKPESLMMTHGYKPEWSEGSVKMPIFQTSTFVFSSAEEGKALFELVTGKRTLKEGESGGLVYSRFNNPNLEIVESRLTLYEKGAQDACIFESGMAAISTAMLEFLRPGDVVLHSNPLYGGTDSFVKNILSRYGIQSLGFMPEDTKEDIMNSIKSSGFDGKIAMVFVETPANPNNVLIDIEMCVSIAKELSTSDKKVITMADNTYLGPIWQSPLLLGCDLTVYSATKYIGGHSDIVAGAIMGSKELVGRVKKMRNNLGGMSGPHTAWLMARSLETLKIRMQRQGDTAQIVAKFLRSHDKVEKVYYLDQFDDENQARIFKNQCTHTGAMISFDLKGGEKECFVFLNHLKLIKLAVSLGSTESLIQHPYSMTHAGVPEDIKQKINVTDKLIRFSVGVEDAEDLITDLTQALSKI